MIDRKIFRYIVDNTNPDLAYDAIVKAEKTIKEISELERKLAKLKVDFDAERFSINDRIRDLQAQCDHPSKTCYGVPTDAGYICDVCGKEV